MKRIQGVFITILMLFPVLRANAYLSWSWNYIESNVIPGPADTIEVMIQVANSPSSGENLNIGGASITFDTSWTSFYALQLGSVSVYLYPGESVTIPFGTFTPLANVPAGTEFTFNTSLYAMPPFRGGSISPQPANEPLHITVIPEPASLALLLVGTIALLRRGWGVGNIVAKPIVR